MLPHMAKYRQIGACCGVGPVLFVVMSLLLEPVVVAFLATISTTHDYPCSIP